MDMQRSRWIVIAVLASLCACGQSGAGPVLTAAGTETIVLPRITVEVTLSAESIAVRPQ
ncbi:hypothetical protein ACWEQG_37950 [Microbispora sp. NPDC004025]